MYNRAEIWTELKEIAPITASIGHQEVYQVPAGYFDGLAESIMLRIQTDADIDEVFLPNIAKDSAFSVPEGYFEGFAGNLLSRIKSQNADIAGDEIRAISPLLNSIDRRMPFSVPPGYFNDFGDVLASAINESGYESEVLDALRGREVYSAPAGYFDGFAGQVLAAVAPKVQAKVISIKKQTNWFRYAAAAVMVGVIATSSVFFFRAPSGAISEVIPNISKVADDEIINYLDNLSSPPVSAEESNSIASVDINDADAKDLFSDISDDELQQYVEQHENSKNLITN